ncbi:flagellar filament capping protein FliD [Anaerocolumna sedimenticola]|uniref:Flagellar hook-associated protein 2 n=1 Tax=Anaerocolumna sedimenticola TaxID=2696063 RepID=A0A6P1TKN9_9FIRM|nr:flagellar filament capping protein FliD [Anaerocolumna sedimenticola]QHQ60672.1 flagellar filament capping protein FliD [Anaerocolumna sedimenticola]
MSTIRMTGLISGLDTESIIKELMSAQRLKNKKTSDKLTLSEWKEDKWKELNAKLYKLYTEDLSKLRLQGGYKTKKATSSNDDLVTVTGGSSAPEGAHTLTVEQLASSQYVTGGKLGTVNGKAITTSTTLKDLGMTVGTTINVTSNGKQKSLVVSDRTTLDDFISTCSSVGLNASYDTTQKRLFISSKASGAANSFTITSDATSFNDIKNLAGYSGLDATKQRQVSDALTVIKGISSGDLESLYTKALDGTAGANAEEQKKIDAIKTLQIYTVEQAKADKKAECIANVKQTDVRTNLLSSYSGTTDDENKILAIKDEIQTQVQEQIAAGKLTLNDTETVESYAENLYNTYIDADRDFIFSKAIDRKYASDPAYAARATTYYNTAIADPTFSENVLSTTNTSGIYSKLSSYLSNTVGDLSALGLSEITGAEVTTSDPTAMSVIKAADASIILDGANLTSSSNSITVNGLTINLKGKTEAGKTITLDVSNDTQATYDKIKDFIKSYNEILKEMNDLYYAGSSRGYDPLSDDEKEAMTDDQIAKWETKIKDSILRRDSTLGSVIDSMKIAMMSSVSVDGKKYSLSSFGIQTSTDYTEKGLLHIYGNKEDSTYSDKDDKLMKALTENPDATIEALAGIFGELYDTMNDKMSSIPNVRSIYKFYNDKLMDNEQTEYKKKVAALEDKLSEMENKYYKQFSAMETALAKMQSQSSSLAGLLGTSNK